MSQRLAQSAARQQTAIAEHIEGVYQNHIQITLQMPVLIAVIHDNNFGVHFIHGKLPCQRPVLANDYRYARQSFSHQISFVTGFIGSHKNFLAVADDAHFLIPM